MFPTLKTTPSSIPGMCRNVTTTFKCFQLFQNHTFQYPWHLQKCNNYFHTAIYFLCPAFSGKFPLSCCHKQSNFSLLWANFENTHPLPFQLDIFNTSSSIHTTYHSNFPLSKISYILLVF